MGGTINKEDSSKLFFEKIKLKLKENISKHDENNYGEEIYINLNSDLETKETIIIFLTFFDDKEFYTKLFNSKLRLNSVLNIPNFIGINSLTSKEEYKCCVLQKKIYISIEYIENSLLDFIILFQENRKMLRDTNRLKNFSVSQIFYIIKSIIEILINLKKYSIVLKNLKPENILIDRSGVLKLIDSNFFKNSSDFNFLDSKYYSPEILKDLLKMKYNENWDWEKNNIFVIGLIMLETTNFIDFSKVYNSDNGSVRFTLIKKAIEEIKLNFNSHLGVLIENMLENNITQRYNYEQIQTDINNYNGKIDNNLNIEILNKI